MFPILHYNETWPIRNGISLVIPPETGYGMWDGGRRQLVL